MGSVLSRSSMSAFFYAHARKRKIAAYSGKRAARQAGEKDALPLGLFAVWQQADQGLSSRPQKGMVKNYVNFCRCWRGNRYSNEGKWRGKLR